MKTLPKNETQKFFNDKGSYELMVSNFKALANDPEKRKELDCYDYFLYAVLRGKDWTKGFSKVYSKDPSFPRQLGLTQGSNSCWEIIRNIFSPYMNSYYKTKLTWCYDIIDHEYLREFFKYGNFKFFAAISGEAEPYPIVLKEEVGV